MKNLKTILILLVVFAALYGCSKSSEKLITGKWYESTDKVDSIKNGQTIPVSSSSIADGSYLQLNSNGTGAVYEPAYGGYADTTVNITYTLSGSALALNYPAYGVYGYYYPAHTAPWTIVSLSSTELSLKYVRVQGSGTSEYVQYVTFKK